MNRFKILKGVDPFAKNPNGDGHQYHLMGFKFRGWTIGEPVLEGTCPYNTSIILEVSGKNTFKFLETLKNIQIEIQSKNKMEIFEGKRVKNSTYTIKSRVHFSGRIVKIRTPNYIIGKA